MDIRDLLIELWEKIGLIATAGLLSVLVPQLRNRLLGLGRPRDLVVAFFFGLFLSMWGAKMGFMLLGHHVDLRAVGIMTVGLLAGPRLGAAVGLFAGAYYVTRVYPAAGVIAIVASVLDGLLIGVIAKMRPKAIMGWRALLYAAGVQLISLGVFVSVHVYNATIDITTAWPALLAQLAANAAGIALFVNVARIVLGREEQAVALVQARAAADAHSLHALRSRLEPHFLFNALNTLRATIRRDPNKARELVSDLADLYRYLLHHPDDAPLEKEVDHACAYLAIEQARFGESRIQIRREIDPSVGNIRVPALLLQPIVENAIHHGISKRTGPGEITISAGRQQDNVVISVRDHTIGAANSSVHEGAGIAMDNLRQRLHARYGERASLVMDQHATGMNVVFTLPVISEGEIRS